MSVREWREDREKLIDDADRANELWWTGEYTYKDISLVIRVPEYNVQYLLYSSQDEYIKQFDTGFPDDPPKWVEYLKKYPGEKARGGSKPGRKKKETAT